MSYTDEQIAAAVTAGLTAAAPSIAAAIKAALSADAPADQAAPLTADAAEEKAAPAPEGKLLTRTSLRAFKKTRAGKAYAKAHEGASVVGIRDGKFPMPAGYRLPTGEAKDAIAKAKEAKEAQA